LGEGVDTESGAWRCRRQAGVLSRPHQSWPECEVGGGQDQAVVRNSYTTC